jgi:hypothetical protein
MGCYREMHEPYDEAMMAARHPDTSPKRGLTRSELLASLSLAIDIGFGQPMEHVALPPHREPACGSRQAGHGPLDRLLSQNNAEFN